MQLTLEQQAVVDIDKGRHLVLAPPGSGKTEMLTQRVVSALRNGVDPKKMFCVTFTVRAGVEMRERVAAAVATEANLLDKTVPDIGNIHHFCNRVLIENNLITAGQRVVDDIAQKELIKDVWIQLKKELKEQIKLPPKEDKGGNPEQLEFNFEEREVADVLCVLDYFRPNIPDGVSRNEYYARLLGIVEKCEGVYASNQRSVYPDLVTASARIHRQAMGVPFSLLLPMSPKLQELWNVGLLKAISSAYVHLKDRFGALDFDDLLTNTYLALKEERILPTACRFTWIQVDEVQDLNALQWAIVRMVSSDDAVAVYFGDAEQTIFSFMGASLERLSRVASDCEIHYFRKNFRATDYLLDMLVRYSIKVLRSKWLFLPQPSGTDFDRGELFLGQLSVEGAVTLAQDWLQRGKGKNVALLVRRNGDADAIEQIVKRRNVKYVKVSGVEIFELNAMRDFMALCTLLADGGALMVWARMFRRFGGIKQDHISRRLVKLLIDSGVTPEEFLKTDGSQFSNWTQERLQEVHRQFSGLWKRCVDCLNKKISYRKLFEMFEQECWERKLFSRLDYVTREELHQYAEEVNRQKEASHIDPTKPKEIEDLMPLPVARERFRNRCEKFFNYLDKKYQLACEADKNYAEKTFAERLKIEWRPILQLREADLMVGDEEIIISTIHKAKGRQFDGVIIPYCQENIYPSYYSQTDDAVDEDARVLYVGLSRAKRNLAVCWEEGKHPSRFLKAIASCFKPDFRNFFRADRSPNDWLVAYNAFLEEGSRHECNRERVEGVLLGNDLIVQRMALATMQYADDVKWRDQIYQRFLDMKVNTSEVCDCVKEVLKGIATLKLEDFIANNRIRKAFLYSAASSHKDTLRFAMLACYGAFLQRPEVSLDDVLEDRPVATISDNVRDLIKDGIEDALFDSNGDVRLEAVRILREYYDADGYRGFDGSDNDWSFLRNHLSEKRIRIVTWMLEKRIIPDFVWRERLNKLIRRS